MGFTIRLTDNFGAAVLIAGCWTSAIGADDESAMNPFFTARNYTLPQDTIMVMGLADLQVARYSPNFATGMGMVEYGITSNWTAGFMVEGQKIEGLPLTYGGERINTYFKVFPNDNVLNFTLYGEYEHLNGASLYKMEVAGFGGENLTEPLTDARRTRVRTIEARALMYHDWGRTNLTFNFISETGLDTNETDFGYTWGIFRHPEWMGMAMAGMHDHSEPPMFSCQRLGYGVEMLGALGNTNQFGIYWNREQHYLGPVISYVLAQNWTAHVEAVFGLTDVSDPVVFRMGLAYSLDHLLSR